MTMMRAGTPEGPASRSALGEGEMSDMKFKVGQVWRDKDPRQKGQRTVTLVAADQLEELGVALVDVARQVRVGQWTQEVAP